MICLVFNPEQDVPVQVLTDTFFLTLTLINLQDTVHALLTETKELNPVGAE